MYMQCRVHILPLGKTYLVDRGTSLHEVLKDDVVEFPCGGKGTCGKCRVKLISGEITIDARHRRALEKLGLSPQWRLACYSRVEADITIELDSGGMRIQSDNSAFKFQPEQGYGIAVDLGSTTIVVQLVNRANGEIKDTRSAINPQSHYGADIISRISYAMESEQNAQTLMWAVRNHIGNEISQLLANNEVKDVERVVIAGNTVMHHLFSGIDVSPLAAAPFQGVDNTMQTFSSEELKWSLPAACKIEFLPNLSHFVGSDILCGIQSCNMLGNGWSLLVDLGTNGEIALAKRGKVVCTSTAAGPAFEGINISCGMRATSGAVYAVDYLDGKFEVRTVDDLRAKGLCGSGLVEAVHALLKGNKIDFTGAIVDDADYVDITDSVRLTIADIREFQLAKAALAAGVAIILKNNGVRATEVENVYITGGLGNYLNVDKIKELGLFTEFAAEKIHKVSNAALAGCRELLFESNRGSIAKVVDCCSFCALESCSDFQDVYCENLYFS